jgi:hypothetical protein
MSQYLGLVAIVFHMYGLLNWSAAKGKVQAQIVFDVACPNVNIVQGFDMQKVL